MPRRKNAAGTATLERPAAPAQSRISEGTFQNVGAQSSTTGTTGLRQFGNSIKQMENGERAILARKEHLLECITFAVTQSRRIGDALGRIDRPEQTPTAKNGDQNMTIDSYLDCFEELTDMLIQEQRLQLTKLGIAHDAR